MSYFPQYGVMFVGQMPDDLGMDNTTQRQLSQVAHSKPACASDKTCNNPDQRDTEAPPPYSKSPPPYTITGPNEPVPLHHIPPGRFAGQHHNSYIYNSAVLYSIVTIAYGFNGNKAIF